MKTGIRTFVATTIVVSLSLGGCAATDTTPLVPEDLVASIQEDGREHTYDVAWQNTRLLVSLLDDEAFHEAEALALELSARLHRLEKARAEDMSDRATASTITRLEDGVVSRSRQDNLEQASTAAAQTLELFDEGDFEAAKTAALEVLVIVRSLLDGQ
jgi:hypothetical protein